MAAPQSQVIQTRSISTAASSSPHPAVLLEEGVEGDEERGHGAARVAETSPLVSPERVRTSSPRPPGGHHLTLRLLQRHTARADLPMQPQLVPVLDRGLRPVLEPKVVG